MKLLTPEHRVCRDLQSIGRLMRPILTIATGIPLTSSVQTSSFRKTHGEHHWKSIYWHGLPWNGSLRFGVTTIDRCKLAEIRQAIDDLRSFDSRLLGSRIDRPAEWFDRIDALVDRIENVIRYGEDREGLWQSIDCNSAAETFDRAPKLNPLIRAIRFLQSVSPQRDRIAMQDGQSTISWIMANRCQLESIVSHLELVEGEAERIQTPTHWSGLRPSLAIAIQLACYRDSIDDQVSLRGITAMLSSNAMTRLNYLSADQNRRELRDRLIQAFDHQQTECLLGEAPTTARQTCLHSIDAMFNRLRYMPSSPRRDAFHLMACLGRSDIPEHLEQMFQKIDSQYAELKSISRKLLLGGASTVWSNPAVRKLRRATERTAQNIVMRQTLLCSLGSLLAHPLIAEGKFIRAAVNWFCRSRAASTFKVRLLNCLLEQIPAHSSRSTKEAFAEVYFVFLSRLTAVFRRNQDTSSLQQILLPQSPRSERHSIALMLSRWIEPNSLGPGNRLRYEDRRALCQLVESLEAAFCGDSKLASTQFTGPILASFPVVYDCRVMDFEPIPYLAALSECELSSPLRGDHVELAAKLSSDPSEQADISVGLCHGYFSPQEIEGLERLATDRCAANLIRISLADRHVGRLRRLLTRLITAETLGRNVFVNSADGVQRDNEVPKWVDSYPSRLHASLLLLAESSCNADRMAAKVLSKSIPDRERLIAERTFLSGCLRSGQLSESKHASIKHRYSVVNRWLEESPRVSARRLDNLDVKVRRRAALETESKLHQWIKKEISEALVEMNMDVVRSKHSDRIVDTLVGGISELVPEFRKLGWDVLRYALADQPYPCQQHEQNRAFITDMYRRGLHMLPWIDPSRIRIYGDGDQRIKLQFAASAMDYLLMGQRFSTCLAPYDSNFFSTIANAVDINKQVLYGRTESGAILGRCLMVLGAEGQILVYRAYSHRCHDEFRKAVKSFVGELAFEMNTTVTKTAEVPFLVATDWYDDDAIKLPEMGTGSPTLAAPNVGQAVDLSLATFEFFAGC